jgi:hypothetical protein
VVFQAGRSRELSPHPKLRPDHPIVLEQRRLDGTHDHECLGTDDRAAEVDRLGLRRAELLALHGIDAADVTLNASRGRLLVAEIDNSVWDGLSKVESGGFFDAFDIPTWDTWIRLSRTQGTDSLLCWVPSPLIQRVSNGIAVNCMDCIGWVARLV